MTTTNIRSEQIKDDSIQIADLSDFAVIKRTTGLILDVNAGTLRSDNVITIKTAQTITVSDNTTNYIELDSTGTVQTNTSGFTSGNVPLATSVSSSGNITTVNDKRAWITISGSTGTTQNLTAFNVGLMGA